MNNLGIADPRVGVLEPAGPLLIDVAVARMHSNANSERFGQHVSTAPTAALPVNFDLATSTRVDFTKQYHQSGVLTQLTVGPLPEPYGVSYDGS